ncbi:uncharacterized protein LOC132803192 [Ziziphus jujuba]|uniref:Uncharacterized protein LOC132803192 n=1 Tax=Ziziphus jujuba TaxID=326968 RepID=A0ABM4A3Z1_ZIZJJ|nr:uncharacterized protein LOC132803192 [Ziziphus jujuba]
MSKSNVPLILKYKRDFPPDDYSLKVDSYTLLLESKTEKYDTNVFEVGGHKWRISFYPNGDKKNNGNGYISLYLRIVETDTYASDGNGAIRRFHAMKKEWGIARLLPLETFKNPSLGYLVNDSCVFGVEAFVINYTGNWESISVVREPKNGTFTWKIENFSNLDQPCYYSQAFNVEGVNWKLLVYPNGNGRAKNKSISIFLSLADWGSCQMQEAVYAEFKLRLLDQVNGKHVERNVDESYCFKGNVVGYGLGYPSFMSLSDLRDASKGFIVKDTLIVEVDLRFISVSNVSSKKEKVN